MSEKFESEIRILIKDIDKFLVKLKKLDAKIYKKYKFTDYIYIPRKPASDWNLNTKNMRIRTYFEPQKHSQILFTENHVIQRSHFQFKHSKYPQGKIELFRGKEKIAKALLQAWDFRHHFIIEKEEGTLYKIEKPKNFIVAVEKITQLGYSAEIEAWGQNLDQIENEFLEIIALLDISITETSSNTLPFIVAKHLKLVD